MRSEPMPPRRPWWKKKRWQVASAVLLVLAYPASAGPAAYLDGAGMLSGEVAKAPYLPLFAVSGHLLVEPWMAYADWFHRLGQRHRASD